MASPRNRREPGVSSWIARAVLLELDRRGLGGPRLLERNGLTREELLDPDGWIPLRTYAGFFREAVHASGDAAFAIGVGRGIPVQQVRVAGYAAASSATLGEACETLGKFNALLRDGSFLTTRRSRAFDAVLARRPPAFPVHEDLPALAVGILDFFAFAAGRQVFATEVRLTGPAPGPGDRLSAALGAPIHWGADVFEMRFPRGTLDIRIEQADPSLHAILEEAAQRELAMRTAPRMTDRVRAAILQLGFDGSAAVSRVAKALGTTARTLQRRLAEEGVTYSDLREEALRDAAARMLANESGPVEEVALRLGFSSRGGFHQAVRRWTGKTPGQLRVGRAHRKTPKVK